MVTAALGLELAKPLAIAGAIKAGWRRPVQTLGLAMLGCVAVAFSLKAELSLMATARSDAVAERAGESQRSADARAGRDRLAAKLAAMPLGRPSAAVQAEIDGKLSSRRDLAGCEAKWLPSSRARAVCIRVGKLRAEKLAAEAREGVETELATAEATLRGLGASRTADPVAVALVAYAKPAGFLLDPGAVGQWLALIPVLALEAGSALAGLLLGGFKARDAIVAGQQTASAQRQAEGEHGATGDQAAVAAGLSRQADAAKDSPAVLADQYSTATDSGPIGQVTERQGIGPQSSEAGEAAGQAVSVAEARVREAIEAAGGRWVGSQRQLAATLGLGRSAVSEALRRLADKRTVRLSTDPRGSEVELLAGDRIVNRRAILTP
jgi:hypothetical protein